jgi:prophage regulatory protein
MASYSSIPETGFLRLNQIVRCGTNAAAPIIPIGKSAWWAGVKNGTYPKPVKLGRSTLWNAGDIRELVDRISDSQEAA